MPSKKIIVPKGAHGVCVWEVDGKLVADSDLRYLSLEGVVGDPRVEEKVRKAAHYWLGEPLGKPKWFPGARKVSDDEFDDQKERLIDGKIPDYVDEIHQIQERRK